MVNPLISIIIPTYNEQDNIGKCLDSVLMQNYPKDKLDIIVIDDNSTDKTQEIAAKYPVNLIIKNTAEYPQGAEPSKIIGYTLARGELFMYLDADAFLSEPEYLNKIITPLINHPELAGSFTRFLPDLKNDPAINRYLSYHPLHLDPLLRWICYPIEKTFIKKGDGFMWCEFGKKKTPPIGICMYRMDDLREVIGNPKTYNWIDIEIPLTLASKGRNKFAYIPNSGHYHLTVTNMKDLLRQKKRDVVKTYLPALGKRKFTYVNFSNPFEFLRLALFVVYANSIIGPLLSGLWQVIKYKDIACLYELPATMLVTDYVAYFFTKHNLEKILKRKYA